MFDQGESSGPPKDEQPSRTGLLQSIRGKLLAAFALLLVAFGVTVSVAGRGLAVVGENASAVHEETLPLILAYHDIEAGIQDVVGAVGRLPSANDEADLDVQLAEIRRLQDVQDRGIEAVPAQRVELAAVTEQVQGYVTEQGRLVRELLRARREQSELVAETLVRTSRLDELLEDAAIDNEFAGLDTEELGQIRLGLSGLIQSIQLADAAQTPALIDTLDQRTRNRVSGMTAILIRLPEDQASLVSGSLLAIIERCSGDLGLINGRRRILGLQDEISQLSERGAASLKAVSRLGEQYSRAAEEESLRARKATGAARQRALVSLWTLIVLLGLAAIATMIYVERRVLRRLKGIVDELTRLSRGELEVALTPGGERELAELADAAEIFRQNAVDLSHAMDGLETRNAQLAEFAYVASHDLKSPLRAIANLAGWVMEDCKDVLPAESADHLERMVERAQRMENLLEDLLRYSRVGHEASPPELINLGELLLSIGDLVAPEGELVVDLQSQPLVLSVARPPLELVLRNLISNSLSHADSRPVRVEASFAALDEGGFQLDLLDNGPGIPPDQREKVFGLFTRLDHRAGGTGMGLALVRRTSESMGGSVEAIEREGRGAHLRLIWPAESVGNVEPSELSAGANPFGGPPSSRGLRQRSPERELN